MLNLSILFPLQCLDIGLTYLNIWLILHAEMAIIDFF